ncbi:MAG: molybdopterin-synthase adenylyltransferase MoeB [Planctomycetota bacterium]
MNQKLPDGQMPDPMPLEVDRNQVGPWLEKGTSSRIVDVREELELGPGILPGAIHIPLAQLPGLAAELLDQDEHLLIYCQKGIRSYHAVTWLREQGWNRSTSLRGGFAEWARDGMPVAASEIETSSSGIGLNAEERNRYARHLTIPEVGIAGQEKLLAGRVLLVGCGGLGSPAALYLAAAGVGQLTIADDDHVEASNLQRQVLYRTDEIGESKALAAARTLKGLNPGIEIEALSQRVTETNVESLVSAHDVILDGADNFHTRFLINDTAVKHGIPIVHGSVYRFEGQVTVFDPAHSGPCLRCLHPQQPDEGSCASCAEAGVLGVIPGIVGTIQAAETIKLLLGQGDVLRGRLLAIDALQMTFRQFEIPVRSDCEHCI